MVHRRTHRALFWACPLLLALPAWAQPANDLCTNAPSLSLGTPVAGTTAGAAAEVPWCNGQVAGDVWYSFTPASAGVYDFTASASQASTLGLAVVTAGCGDIQAVVACEFGSGSNSPSVRMRLGAGEQVFVVVGSTDPSGQAVSVTASGPVPAPANNECAAAVPVQLGVPYSGDNFSATTSLQLGSANFCSSVKPGSVGGSDVFLSFTPATTGHYDVATCGTLFDSVVSVHSACPATAANAIACNDDAPLTRCTEEERDGAASYVTGVPMTAGVTYYIRVAGVFTVDPRTGRAGPAAEGAYTVRVDPGSPVARPANDLCENAETLAPDTFVMGTTIDATGQPGACDNGQDPWDVWYRFTAPVNGGRRFYLFTIANGSFDDQTTLSAYDACGGQLLSCQYFFGLLSAPDMTMSLIMEPGQTALIRVAGRFGTQDEFALITASGGEAAPNDRCQNALAISANVVTPFDNSITASDQETPCGFFDTYPLWYAFTPAQTGYYKFLAEVPEGSSDAINSTIALYSACGVQPMVCSPYGDLGGDLLSAVTRFHATAGQTIYVRVSFQQGARSSGELSITGPLPPPPPLPSDTCAGATVVPSMPFHQIVDVTLATQDQNVCFGPGFPPHPTDGGVWFSYTPATNVFFAANVRTFDRFDTVSVFTGSCGALTQVGCALDFQPGAMPGLPMTAGTTYHILVSTLPSDTVSQVSYGLTYEVNFVAEPAPANDECATATPVNAFPSTFALNTIAADHDTPAPSCGGSDGEFKNAVWYRVTPQTAGTLTVQLVHTSPYFGYDPAIAVFSGSCAGLTEIGCAHLFDGGQPIPVDPPVVGFQTTADLAAGQTYYVGVGAWTFPQGGPTQLTFLYGGGSCRADFDGSGAVNVSDIFSFLSAWFAGAATADIDGNGQAQVSDIFAFLSLWFAGC